LSSFDDAAPLRGEERQFCTSTSNPVKVRHCGRRHRGCRSQAAVSRRATRFNIRRSQEEVSGQSRHESPPHEFNLQPLHMLSCNIRSLMGKIRELRCFLEEHDIYIVCIQESWLDASVENPVLPNYYVVARKDRSHKANRGGVITYARQDFNNVVLLKKSDHSERMWDLVQRDTGDIAFCNWYFSPAGEIAKIESLRHEIDKVSRLADSCMIFGDLGIHHGSWLKFSNGESPKGRLRKEICDSYDLHQLY
jgi:hypothetical protein